MRSWGNHMVHHAIYYKQNYSYFGIIEALSGAPFDVSFISFDDIRENKDLLNDFDVIINVGDADTAQSGGENWANPEILTAVRKFVYNGGGFIGVGEPAAHQWQGKFFQLDDILGVEEERGFNLNTDKYNWEEHRDHFILEDTDGTVDFGEGKKNIFALPDTKILIQKDQEVQMAVKPSERVVAFISAGCLTALKTVVFCTDPCSGLRQQRMNFTAGSRLIIMWKFMPM